MWELRLQADKTGESRVFAVLTPEGLEIREDGASENATMWWRLSIDSVNPFGVSLLIDGQMLDRVMESERVLWFKWDVGFNAGFVDVDVNGVQPRSKAGRIIVDPARQKLVRSEYRQMLRDIIDDTRSLAVTAGFRVAVARGDQPLKLAKIEYLLENIARLEDLVGELDRTYKRRLERGHIEISPWDARAVSSYQWSAARRSNRMVSAEVLSRLPLPARAVIARVGGYAPTALQQRTIRHTSNRLEHKEILGLLLDASRQLTSVSRSQSLIPQKQRNVILLARCMKANRRLARLRELAVFRGIEPRNGHWQPSPLYESVEPYRSLFKLHRDFLAGISSIDGDFASVPIQETFRLYETWVALRLARAAAIIDPSVDGSVFFTDATAPDGLTFTMQSASIRFSGMTMRFKPLYREHWTGSDSVGSSSKRMIPDVVIDFVDALDGKQSLLILDTKYRVGAQINDAIDSIHTYRDALIETSQSGQVRHVVTAGVVIVPISAAAIPAVEDWELAKTPAVYFHQGFQARYRLGAIALKPGTSLVETAASLAQLIERFASTRRP